MQNTTTEQAKGANPAPVSPGGGSKTSRLTEVDIDNGFVAEFFNSLQSGYAVVLKVHNQALAGAGPERHRSGGASDVMIKET